MTSELDRASTPASRVATDPRETAQDVGEDGARPQKGDPAALRVVRHLHSPRVFSGDGYGWTLCAEDRQQWPCATETAIREALDE